MPSHEWLLCSRPPLYRPTLSTNMCLLILITLMRPPAFFVFFASHEFPLASARAPASATVRSKTLAAAPPLYNTNHHTSDSPSEPFNNYSTGRLSGHGLPFCGSTVTFCLGLTPSATQSPRHTQGAMCEGHILKHTFLAFFIACPLRTRAPPSLRTWRSNLLRAYSRPVCGSVCFP